MTNGELIRRIENLGFYTPEIIISSEGMVVTAYFEQQLYTYGWKGPDPQKKIFKAFERRAYAIP